MPDTIQAPAGGNERFRVSAWADPIVFANTVTKKDAQGKPAVFLDSTKPLFKTDAVLRGKGIIDDISLLMTFRTDENMGFVWDDGLLQGQGDAVRQTFVNQAIDECHAKGIQCLVGFALLAIGNPPGPKFSAFNQWLRSPTNPTIDGLATTIVTEVLNL